MKNLIFITTVIIFISCSEESKKPEVAQIKTEQVIQKPVIEYKVLTLDSNTRFKLEYTFVNPYQKSKFLKGKTFYYMQIGDTDDEETAGYSYTTGQGEGVWRDKNGNVVSEPMDNNTIFQTTITDPIRKLTFVSRYKCPGYYYEMNDSGPFASELMCGLKSNKVSDKARQKWNLTISNGKETLSFKFTKDGVEVPKQFSEDFKKSFSL